MKVLITGAHGMVGKNLTILLKKCNFKILTPTREALDLMDDIAVVNYITRHEPTHVVHLAADVGGLYKNMSQNLDMFENNLVMNTNLLKGCRKNQIKNVIVMLSTCVFPKDTSYPLDSQNINAGVPHPSNEGYSYSKRMMERYVQYVRDTYGWNWKAYIPVNIFGKYDNYDLETAHVIPALIHKAYVASRDKTPFTLKGDGSALRQFIYAEDVAEIIYQEICEPQHDHNKILCTTAEYSIREIAYQIADYFDIEQTVFDESFSSGQHKKTVEPLDSALGDFETDLKVTMKWFTNNYLNVRCSNY